MSSLEWGAPHYVSPYTPDPEILESLRPEPPLSAIGSLVVHEAKQHAYEVYRDDIVASPYDDIDPRDQATTAAEGYPELEHHSDQIPVIDAHYQPSLDQTFYERHGLTPGLALSDILKFASSKDAAGVYNMSRGSYISLLADIQAIHDQATKAFIKRLPAYIDNYPRNLHTRGLSSVIPVFQERIVNTRVQFDDGFDTLARGYDGWYEGDEGTHTIALAPIESREQDTLIHEFTHLSEGDDLALTISEHPYVVWALREALASHINAIFVHKKSDIQEVNPLRPDRKGFAYDSLRHMLDLLCNGGTRILPVRSMIDADLGHTNKPQRHITNTLASSFPDHPDLLDQLEGRLIQLSVPEKNAFDEKQEEELVQYVGEVRAHYPAAVKKMPRWRSAFKRSGS